MTHSLAAWQTAILISKHATVDRQGSRHVTWQIWGLYESFPPPPASDPPSFGSRHASFPPPPPSRSFSGDTLPLVLPPAAVPNNIFSMNARMPIAFSGWNRHKLKIKFHVYEQRTIQTQKSHSIYDDPENNFYSEAVNKKVRQRNYVFFMAAKQIQLVYN